jgi:uncharacterized protein YbcC (UPF0753/DUF2309 family)
MNTMTSTLHENLQKTIDRIAPLWPLDRFVAVNPLWGYRDMSFPEACLQAHLNQGFNTLPPAKHFNHSFRESHVQQDDIICAAEEAHYDNLSKNSIFSLLKRHEETPYEQQPIPTLAMCYDHMHQTHWHAQLTEEANKYFNHLLAARFASWSAPGSDLGLFSQWKMLASLDFSLEYSGLSSVHLKIDKLPDCPLETLTYWYNQGFEFLNEQIFLRHVSFHLGWFSLLRMQDQNRNVDGLEKQWVIHALAIVMSYHAILWQTSSKKLSYPHLHHHADLCPAIELPGYILLAAEEHAYRRKLIHAWHQHFEENVSTVPPQDVPPSVQAIFCIDVRSEVFRRYLEKQDPSIETIGFAGFFGLPIAYKAEDQPEAIPLCPVLVQPQENLTLIQNKKTIAKAKAKQVWTQLKTAASSCFSLVESLGLLALPSLLFGPVQAKPARKTEDLALPSLDVGRGWCLAILNALQIKQFAPVVLICGHSADSPNNPYIQGLQCGACGGQSGEKNAKLLAELLNHPEIRLYLKSNGHAIPDETIFVGGVHHTTREIVEFFPQTEAQSERIKTLCPKLTSWLKQASHLTREERRTRFPLARQGCSFDKASRDASQPQPEWGLANCAAMIVGPRILTRGLHLQGRAFLHNYNHQEDTHLALLTTIMSAPMVVGHWINLQYYASTVDPMRLGSGNKLIHNRLGNIGILLGNEQGLQIGLPVQSCYDMDRFFHQPLRLQVFIAAPEKALLEVVQKHSMVQHLVENRWVVLHAIHFEIEKEKKLEIRRYLPGEGFFPWDEGLKRFMKNSKKRKTS